MEIGISIETDGHCPRQLEFARALDSALKAHFIAREYGDGVRSITLGLILFEGDSERFHKERPFRFTPRKEFKIPGRSSGLVVEKFVEFDVKPKLMDATAKLGNQFLAETIIARVEEFRPRWKELERFEDERFLVEFSTFVRRFLSLSESAGTH